MKRTWTWIDETHEPTEDMREAVWAECAALMTRWNALEAQLEMRSMRSECDDYQHDYDAEDFETEAQEIASEQGLTGRDAAAFVEQYVDEKLNALGAEHAAEVQRLHQQQDLLLCLLNTLGARLARPYEHWNEEERMVQYLEEDRWL